MNQDHAANERRALIRDDTAFKLEQGRRRSIMLLGDKWLLAPCNRVTKESFRASIKRTK